jgi:hypothetical protein
MEKLDTLTYLEEFSRYHRPASGEDEEDA